MRLDRNIFRMNNRRTAGTIEKFIREKMKEMGRKGIVVAISGGLDSSVVLALCARAVGKSRVTGLMLPEKKGNPDALRFGKMAAGKTGVKTVTVDISPALEMMGVYRFITNYIPGRNLTKKLVSGYLKITKSNPFIGRLQGKGNRLTDLGLASMDTKHRVRLAAIYKYAEERNLLVAGCAHKSEDLLGLFCKFGVDDAADIMPIKNLYRSQILLLAEHLGVPEEIRSREPNPDMIPGVEDKYFDILGLHSDKLDLVLYGLERNMPAREIARQVRVPPEKVREIADIVKKTEHMRRPSQAPEKNLKISSRRKRRRPVP